MALAVTTRKLKVTAVAWNMPTTVLSIAPAIPAPLISAVMPFSAGKSTWAIPTRVLPSR